MRILTLPLLVACSSGTPTSVHSGETGTSPGTTDTPTGGTTNTGGACGDVSTWSLTLLGTVLGADGNPAIGADVWVEDRGWQPGTIVGQGTTDGEGAFSLDLPNVTSVEDCWGTLLDYVLVGERPDEHGEKDVNIFLFNAIDDGSFVGDLGSTPLRLESTL